MNVFANMPTPTFPELHGHGTAFQAGIDEAVAAYARARGWPIETDSLLKQQARVDVLRVVVAYSRGRNNALERVARAMRP